MDWLRWERKATRSGYSGTKSLHGLMIVEQWVKCTGYGGIELLHGLIIVGQRG